MSGHQTRRYAVIGAGAAGLCAAKYLIEAGFADVTIFEVGTRIGGLWCYENDSGLSSAYKTLHINTPKQLTHFRDLPFRDTVQMFPDHRDMHEYLTQYAEHFELVPHIRFRSKVTNVEPAPDYDADAPKWNVTIENGGIETFDCVIVANGHFSSPYHAEDISRQFAGEYLHTHDYREPAPYVGKRVCIIGAGNSAADIASDICMTAERTVMVARSGVVIAPKIVFGMPFHNIKLTLDKPWIPRKLQARVLSALTFTIQGRMTDLGFKPLKGRVHGTSNPVLVQHIYYQRVVVKQGIDRIEGKTLHFVDGTSEEFDVVLSGTGYRVELPFIPERVVPIKNDTVELYKRMIPPGWSGIYFVGLLNTTVVSYPYIFEQQVRWMLPFELGRAAQPSKEEMMADIAAKKAQISRMYSHSRRHAIEEPHDIYMAELEKSRKEGEKRLQQQGRRFSSKPVYAAAQPAP